MMAAAAAKIENPFLPETRVWASNFGDLTFTSPSTWVSSTTQCAYEYRCNRTASRKLDQQYYNSINGRFMTADPYRTSGGPGDPGSWNRYSYVQNDPANHTDHSGTQVDGENLGVCGMDELSPLCAASDGSGLGGAASSRSGGCELDGIGTDCTFLAALARAGALLVKPELNLYGLNNSPDPICVQNAIGTAAVGLGLNLLGFTNISVQIVGTPNSQGGTYGRTELNLSGGDVQALINQLCSLGFSNNSQCPGGANNSMLVGNPHDGFDGNFRSPGLQNSVQVNTNVATGQIQIDVDPFNPAADPILGLLLHGLLQVLPNMIAGTDNRYGCGH